MVIFGNSCVHIYIQRTMYIWGTMIYPGVVRGIQKYDYPGYDGISGVRWYIRGTMVYPGYDGSIFFFNFFGLWNSYATKFAILVLTTLPVNRCKFFNPFYLCWGNPVLKPRHFTTRFVFLFSSNISTIKKLKNWSGFALPVSMV